MPKFLLHTCCAPCAVYVLKQLKEKGFQVTLFFYNPNIQPEAEYYQRLKELKSYLKKFVDINLICGEYEVDKWFQSTKSLEAEPERGKRCLVCYKMRLEKTACFAQEKKYNYFGSTLSISPHKDAQLINKIGEELERKYQHCHPESCSIAGRRISGVCRTHIRGRFFAPDSHRGTQNDKTLAENKSSNQVEFYQADWKKHNGYKRACQLSQKHGFYRQNYCGCIYSKSKIKKQKSKTQT